MKNNNSMYNINKQFLQKGNLKEKGIPRINCSTFLSKRQVDLLNKSFRKALKFQIKKKLRLKSQNY